MPFAENTRSAILSGTVAVRGVNCRRTGHFAFAGNVAFVSELQVTPASDAKVKSAALVPAIVAATTVASTSPLLTNHTVKVPLPAPPVCTLPNSIGSALLAPAIPVPARSPKP